MQPPTAHSRRRTSEELERRRAEHVTSDAVSVRDLCVVRGRREVLHGLSFDLPLGKVTGLLGPSGSGKTTLLRALLGVQRITSGTASVLGLPAGDPRLRALIGYASQAAAVYDDLSVLENLRYFSAAVHAPAGDIDRVIKAVDLAGQESHLTGRLSGGQRSRVSLAVAMLGSPPLLVLDEPTVGLDPVLRENLWSLFHRLADTDTTLLVSSHVMDEAERCDELLLLRDGRVLTQDTPEAFKQHTGASSMEDAFLRMVQPA